MYIIDDICYAENPSGEIDVAPEYVYEHGVRYTEDDDLLFAG